MFRVDSDRPGASPVVLVQSDREPDWSALPGGYLSRQPESKRYDPSFTTGQRLRFRLRANPTKRVAAKNERLGGVMCGKRVGLAGEVDQLRWLLRKAQAGGFRIPGGWVDARHPDNGQPVQLPNFRVDVIPEGRDRNGKPGHGGELLAVRFEGLLEVADPVAFRTTLVAGIGPGKAFGFGLLSVAPA